MQRKLNLESHHSNFYPDPCSGLTTTSKLEVWSRMWSVFSLPPTLLSYFSDFHQAREKVGRRNEKHFIYLHILFCFPTDSSSIPTVNTSVSLLPLSQPFGVSSLEALLYFPYIEMYFLADLSFLLITIPFIPIQATCPQYLILVILVW